MAAATPDPTGHSPLIRQYLDIKSRHPDSLLFFRVGDFYEMFFEDAEEGSGLLGLTLTARNNGGKRDVPLAGVPVKAVNEYVSRLLEMGRRVAICEQLEDPAEARGIVKRDVVEIITPGTVLEDKLLAAGRNNYVVAIAGDAPFGLAAVDLSTGEFELREVAAPDLDDELGRLEPAEIVIPEETAAPAGPWHLTERPALALRRFARGRAAAGVVRGRLLDRLRPRPRARPAPSSRRAAPSSATSTRCGRPASTTCGRHAWTEPGASCTSTR